jgi:hypothetical protein
MFANGEEAAWAGEILTFMSIPQQGRAAAGAYDEVTWFRLLWYRG